MVTALDVAQALGYALLVAGFALWVTLSTRGVNGSLRRSRRAPKMSPSSRGTCARPPRRRR